MSILAIGLILAQIQLASASGIVLKPGGSEPLPKATVTLEVAVDDPKAEPLTVVTGDDGRFSIKDIEPGDYRLTVESSRFGRVSYGQRRPGGPGAILSLNAGREVSDLRISMTPTGAIAGRITKTNGEPLVNATVQALKSSYLNGKKVLTPAQATTTDDRGEYRLFWLTAGKYVVTAAVGVSPYGMEANRSPRPNLTVPPMVESFEANLLRAETLRMGAVVSRVLEDGTRQEEAWAPVYYPASTEERFATPLDVSPGSTVTGIDIAVGPARAQMVRGRVVGFAPGSTPTVMLMFNQGILFSLGIPSGRGASNVDGRFEFSGVLPGTYSLLARDSRSGLVSWPLVVQVGDRDVENLTIGMTPGIDLKVQMVFDGTGKPGDSNPLTGLGILLSPEVPGMPARILSGQPTRGPQLPGAELIPPGEYQIQSQPGAELTPPGDYQIQLMTFSDRTDARPLYIKSARLGALDATDRVRVAANTATTLEVVVTTDSGTVEGLVANSTGTPAPNATVVLVPNVRARINLYQAVVTGADGRFRFRGIAEGDFKLFAWDDVETGAWQDPEFLRTFETRGRSLRVSGRSSENVQLEVIAVR